MGLLKNLFTKNKEVKVKKIDDYSNLLDLTKPKIKEKNKINYFEKNSNKFFIGDKVITKSNDCVDYKIGVITSLIELGSNKNIIPKIESQKGEIYSTSGLIIPYNEKIEKELNDLKPLEQWNYLVPKEVRYTKKEMELKESKYNSIKKIQ